MKIEATLNVTSFGGRLCWLWCFTIRGLLNALRIKAPGSGTTRLPKERHVSEGMNSQQHHCENLKSRKGVAVDDDDDNNCNFNTCSSLLIYVTTLRMTSYKVSVSMRNIIQIGNKNRHKTMKQKYN